MCIIICGNFYSYKNKMPKKDLNLEWDLDLEELESLSLDEESLKEIDEEIWGVETTSEVKSDEIVQESTNNESVNVADSNLEDLNQTSTTIDESVFLDAWDTVEHKKNVLKSGDDGLKLYLRWFFFSTLITLLWLLAIAFFYSFRIYIKEASKPAPDSNYVSYVQKYKWYYKKVKNFLWKDTSYQSPVMWANNEASVVNEIINATDIDYIEKKDLLSNYVSTLVNKTQNRADYLENLKQNMARQWFLPEELEMLLSEDQAIDTIQRSLNALEVIKFSTATRVFLYMNTALSTISEMIRINWVSVESLRELFAQLNSRWEKDITSYVYMCYLNPFEKDADCGEIWDLDLYYDLANDRSINIRLFKNSMSAISQLLEREDTMLFSITFNWFNASDKSIQFNIEVFTSQEDERSLLQQWKKNPNIFILTNIINLLKQSSFIIWADISTKEVNVDTRILTQGGISRPVKYSTLDFTVPIQKNTEREIFDYIDLESMKNLLFDRGFYQRLMAEDDVQIVSDENDWNNQENILEKAEDWGLSEQEEMGEKSINDQVESLDLEI